MKTFTTKLLLAAAVAILAPAAPALADSISFSLTSMDLTGAPGTSVTFDANVSADPGNLGPVDLDTDSFNVDGGLTVDDSDFFNLPIAIDSTNPYSGPLFSVFIPFGTLPGVYDGYFTIIGDFGDLATVDFHVTAAAAASPVPEPGTWLLLSTGLGVACLFRKRLVARPGLGQTA
jgi:hypothetical protein